MKGVKCTGFLIFLGLLALSFLTCSDVSALKHEYIGINTTRYVLPPRVCNNGSCHFDWSSSNFDTYGYGDRFAVGRQGSAWTYSNDDYNHVKPLLSASEISCTDSSSSDCALDRISSQYSVTSVNNVSGHKYFYGTFNNFYLPDQFELNNFRSYDPYYFASPFGDRNVSAHNAFSGIMSCNWLYNGAVCGGLWNTAEYVNAKVFPYPYSSSGFYLKSKATSPSNGMIYSNTFSLSDLYDSEFHKISSLQVPLHTDDGYFWNENNFPSGRLIEFKGVFEFDGNFTWNPNLDSGSEFSIHFTAIKKSNGYIDTDHYKFDCTTNLITVPGATQLEYSCPYTLQDDYLAFFPSLYIAGDDEGCDNDSCFKYVFETDDEWRFAFTYLVTDGDETPGPKFNTDISGGGDIPGDAANEIPSGDGMWQMDAATLDNLIDNFFPNLMGMFNFNLLNPFSSIFGLFTSGEDCVNVPIFASMIHSDNPQVCPWFPGWVRNITTPVMTIVSTMLLFGFILRWVRSSSSDFSPDSSGGKP